MKRTRTTFTKGDSRARSAGRKGGSVTAVQSRATRAPSTITIPEFLAAVPELAAPEGVAWRAFNKVIHGYGAELTDEEREIAHFCTGRDAFSSSRYPEVFALKGRGAGGTKNGEATNAVWFAITMPRELVERVGGRITIPLIARDLRQSDTAHGYVAHLCSHPIVAPYVHAIKGSVVEFKTGVDIECLPANYRAVRSYNCPAAFADEAGHYYVDGVNTDAEILTALRGTLGRFPNALLLVLSSPYAPRGELFEAYERHWGKNDPDVLIWNAATRTMNPTYSRRHIEREWKRDPVAASSEYGPVDGGHVVFRQGDQALFDEAPVKAAIVSGRYSLEPVSGTRYWAFIDMAEGARSGDSATLGIAHLDKGRAVLDVVLEIEPPFDPGSVIVLDFIPVLRRYGIKEVRGDNHARGWVEGTLRSERIKFIPSELSKSELYLELLQLVNTGLVELLDSPKLRTQLLGLQRFAARSGRDSVDHPSGGHDDVANASAGAICSVAGVGVEQKKHVAFSGMATPAGQKESIHDTLAQMIRAAHAEGEAFNDLTRRKGPVDGGSYSEHWHVHKRS